MLLLPLALMLAAGPVAAGDAITVTVQEIAGGQRLLATWPEALAGESLTPEARLQSSVLIVEWPRAIAADLSALEEESDLVARARLDGDGRTLRLALRQEPVLHVQRSDNLVAIDLMDSEATPPVLVSPLAEERQRAAAEAEERARLAAIEAAKPKGPVALPISIANADSFTRVVLDWPVAVNYTLTQTDQLVELQFDWDAIPEMTRLRVEPPEGVAEVADARTEDGWRLRLRHDADTSARVFRDGDKVLIDFAPRVEVPIETIEPATGEALAAAPRTPDPAAVAEDADEFGPALPALLDAGLRNIEAPPATPRFDAPVPVYLTPIAGGMEVVADFPAPVGLAIYQRGDVTYVVFDAGVDLDISGYDLRTANVLSRPDVTRGEDYALLSFVVDGARQITPRADGARWVLDITPERNSPMRDIDTSREGLHDLAALFFDLPQVMRVRRVTDPLIGDDVLVATAGADAPGNIKPRRIIDAEILTSLHGLALVPQDDAVILERVVGGVSLRRDGGLRISPPSVMATDEALRAPDGPAFIETARWRVRPAEFYARKDALERAFAMSQSLEDHYHLAEFLIANGLAPEALGVLRNIAQDDPAQAREARYAGLAGVAAALAHRSSEALTHLGHNELKQDPYALVWKAYAHSQEGNYAPARQLFVAGDAAFFTMPDDWLAKLKLANVNAALEMNDVAAAGRHLAMAEARGFPDQELADRALLLRGQLMAISGDREGAKALYGALRWSPIEEVSAEALLREVLLQHEDGELDQARLVDTLEGLRFRWRGDGLELEIAEALGEHLYELGRVRDGLKIMQTAIERDPDSTEARRITRSMDAVFRDLFLQDGADRMEPIEALALFYEFADLTPKGAEGDAMIRHLADRLVDMDLLKQGAELLEYQIDNRLRGPKRAEVAAELAAVYLLDRQPEAAINTLRRTRLARLPDQLLRERRYLEARALGTLGRSGHAFELLAGDNSVEASALRADIAWQSRDYEAAAAYLERAAEERLGPMMTPAVSRDFLRAALGYQLSGQQDALRALDARHGARMRNGPDASAWAVVTDEVQADGGIGLRELARRLTETDAMDAFLADFRAGRQAMAVSDESPAGNADSAAEAEAAIPAASAS